jgi:transcriptional regulator with XRE-family HTH domain
MRLCRLADISPQSWNNYETADSNIGIEPAIRLCNVTGVTLDWIYRGSQDCRSPFKKLWPPRHPDARSKVKPPTGWQRPLAFPIKLRDGHVIETMAQAAELMTLRLPKARQAKPIWQHTAALLLQAHESGRRLDLDHATAQLRRALDAEGWAA